MNFRPHWCWVLLFTVVLFPWKATAQSTAQSSVRATLSAQSSATGILTLEKPGLRKRIRFFPGDVLEFKLYDDPYRYETVLQGVQENSILVMDAVLPIQEIRKIYVRKKGYYALQAAYRNGTTSGIGFGILGLVMLPLNPTLAGSTLGGSAMMLSAGQLFRVLSKRPYRLGKWRSLKTIQTGYVPPLEYR
ncbi:hypothetical protein [Catalinimonas alkaloidigena]|nr:hypothetical protein [Catalinimonas alkaloidigena]